MSTRSDIASVLAKLGANERQAHEALRTAIYWTGNRILRSAVIKTPVDTGRLRATAYVSLPTTGPRFKCRIGFGTNYAVYVHERTDQAHRPPTKHHFLSNAVKLALPKLKKDITKYAKMAFETGAIVGSGGAFATESQDPGEAWQRAHKAKKRAMSQVMKRRRLAKGRKR